MADAQPRSAKRSRFDQKEPDPKRASRFDRRSRSPSSKTQEARRSRSPDARDKAVGSSSPSAKSPADPAAAAAAAAARINAQIQAKKGIQHVDVPPIISSSSPAPKPVTPTDRGSVSKASTNNVSGEVYIEDGDYIKDIEVNDLRNRYTLTKGSTQKMIKEETGADVTTRGNYYPDKSMATAANPPLYLHVTSTSKDGLEQAIAKIEELMKQELPNLVDERRFRRREPDYERDEFGRRKWPEEKIPIDLEPLPGFNLRAQVVGMGGAFVKHIQQESKCRVQIKGRGSAYLENSTNQESDEPMFLHVAGPDPADVQRGKELCEDLLVEIRKQWQRHKDNPPQRGSYGGSYGGRQNSESYGTAGYGGYGGGSYGSYGSYGGQGGYGSSQSSASQAAPGTSGGQASTETDYSAQWQQYFAENPQMYYYYQQQAQAAQQQPQPDAPGASDPPPPPPSGSPPANGGYNSVPPPPGL